MNKKGKIATGIVTAIFMLAAISVVMISGSSITGAAIGTNSTSGMGALITIIFILSVISLLPAIGGQVEEVKKEAAPTFFDLNSRLKDIDDQLNKIF